MNATLALAIGAFLTMASVSLENSQTMWEYAEWMLLAYWVLLGLMLERAVRYGVAGVRAAEPRRKPVVMAAGALLALVSLPVIYRAVYLLWHFHGRTGKAEGMGYIPLTYPLGISITFVTGLVYLADEARWALGTAQRVVRLVLLIVQHIPHVILYMNFLHPFAQAPQALSRAAGELMFLLPLATFATVIHVVALLISQATRPDTVTRATS